MAILFWSVLTSASDGQAGDITTILKQFPGYHVVTLQERNPDVRAYIVQHFPKANASVVHADFDGDGNEDYALLMKNDRSAKPILVVVRKCQSKRTVDNLSAASCCSGQITG